MRQNYATFWVRKFIDLEALLADGKRPKLAKNWPADGVARRWTLADAAIPASDTTRNLTLAYLTLEPYGA